MNEETVLIDDLLKNVDSSCKVTASGDGNVLDERLLPGQELRDDYGDARPPAQFHDGGKNT